MLIASNEIAVGNYTDALHVAKILVDNNYVVMISREDDLWIVNYEYSSYSDRNDVVFISRDEFEMKYCECDECTKEQENDWR